MLSAAATLYAVCCLSLLALGAGIFLRDPKRPTHRTFALFVLSMVGWLATLFLYYHLRTPAWLTPVGRVNFAAILVAISCGYWFVLELVGRRNRLFRVQLLETLLLATVTLFTPLVSAREVETGSGELVTHFGTLFPLLALHLLAYIGAGVYQLVRVMARASAERRAQLQLVLAGVVATTLVSATTNLVLPALFQVFALQEIGALSVVFLIGAFGYAIVVRHLFDVRIVVKRSLTFTLLVGSLVGLYGALALFASAVLRKSPVTLDEFLFNLGAVTVVGLTSEPLRRWFAARTDRWFFQQDYEQQRALVELDRELGTEFDLDRSFDAVLGTLRRTLHASRAVLYALEPSSDEEQPIEAVRQFGLRAESSLIGHMPPPLVEFARAHPEIAETVELASSADGAPLGRELRSFGIAVTVPIMEGGKLAGLMLLGRKRSGERYSRRDLSFLALLRAPILSSIQKARLTEGDKAKTEMVSIAAHELLTPITGMQGYLSMVLDEGLGTVDDQARGYLTKVYSSARRLAALVKDLLSVSRLESGRMKIEPKAIQLEPLLRDTVDQLAPIASEKGLSLTLKVESHLAEVFADPDRLMEALVNLAGNAVKYTPKGSVTVTASQEGERVKVEIADTGLGMSEEARAHLFEKFYRVHTDATASIPGTGLGLYVTKQMMEKMGGTISVSSEPNVGSTFTLSLPTRDSSSR